MNKSRLLAAAAFAAVLASVAFSANANMAPPNDFYLGLSVAPSSDGPRVTGFAKGSPAERAGVKIGDIILGADGRYTKSMTADELKSYFNGPHWSADLVVVHDGKTIAMVRVRR